METKTQATLNNEPARQLIAIVATVVFFGSLIWIPTRALAEQPWAFLAAPVGLFIGGLVAWVPREKLLTPALFAGALGGFILTMTIALFGPFVRPDPILPADLFNFVVGFRTMLISITLFLIPLFVRAVTETIAAKRTPSRAAA